MPTVGSRQMHTAAMEEEEDMQQTLETDFKQASDINLSRCSCYSSCCLG